MDEVCDVRFKGQIDIRSSNGPRMKTMPLICIEEWTVYVGVVMKSEIHVIELIVRMVAWNDIIRSLLSNVIQTCLLTNCHTYPSSNSVHQ
jgi:hypothetical protein